jgi:uroporphyrinogen-III decarboxylase
MNGRERVLAFLNDDPIDRLPLMPVVMMYCADQIGVKYGEYVKDYRVLAEAQIKTAETLDLDIIGIGDAAASLIGPKFYNELVWPFEQRLVLGIRSMGARVRLHICGNTTRIVEGMGRLGCDIVDLDYFTPVSLARKAMGPNQALLGNIDPVAALRGSTPEKVTKAIAQCHHEAGNRFVVGAGCEIPRDTPQANVQALIEYARLHT